MWSVAAAGLLAGRGLLLLFCLFIWCERLLGSLARAFLRSPALPPHHHHHPRSVLLVLRSLADYGTEGDSWPTNWLQDDTQLTAAGDRGDFNIHMSMWRVNGTSPTAIGDAIPMQPVGSVVWGKRTSVEAQYCGHRFNNVHTVKPKRRRQCVLGYHVHELRRRASV